MPPTIRYMSQLDSYHGSWFSGFDDAVWWTNTHFILKNDFFLESSLHKKGYALADLQGKQYYFSFEKYSRGSNGLLLKEKKGVDNLQRVLSDILAIAPLKNIPLKKITFSQQVSSKMNDYVKSSVAFDGDIA